MWFTGPSVISPSPRGPDALQRKAAGAWVASLPAVAFQTAAVDPADSRADPKLLGPPK